MEWLLLFLFIWENKYQKLDLSRASLYAKKTKNSPTAYLSFERFLGEYDGVILDFVFLTGTKQDDLSRRLEMFSLYFYIILGAFRNICKENKKLTHGLLELRTISWRIWRRNFGFCFPHWDQTRWFKQKTWNVFSVFLYHLGAFRNIMQRKQKTHPRLTWASNDFLENMTV